MSGVDELLHGLNPAQREAAEHRDGPILVVAGAGSGKTRVLTARIAHLIATHGVAPERIFAVTFTNKAAREMRDRVATLLEREPAGLWIGTFHALSARLLRREAERLGFSRQFTIYDEDDRLALIRRILDERNHPVKLYPPRVIQNIISSAKNRMQAAAALEASAPHDPVIRVAADVYGAMQRALHTANAMDFDDLMLHPLALFSQFPDVLARWQRRFDYLMVDEFQDTNRAQYELIRYLGQEHRNVFAVGDEDQSIYGWRGADIRNMRDLQQDFGPAAVVKLEENYRSTRPILDAANAVIANNAGRLVKTLRTRRPGGEAIMVTVAADERDEAEWIAGELRRRNAAGSGWNECAVLYRTNAQSRALEEALRRAGVPYQIIGAISFYDRREVKDLLAYLRLIANPGDDEAFLRAVAVPRRGLGDSALAALAEQAREWNVPLLTAAARADAASTLRPNLRIAFRAFAEQVTAMRTQYGESAPVNVMQEVVRAIDYETLLLAEGPEGIERWENVRELIAAAAEWSEVITDDDEGTTPLHRFLTEAALLAAVDTRAGRPDGVTLMTLHTAKGLEWPVVIIPGVEDGLFPSARAVSESAGGLEEERRLAYVGITRARDALILTWARSRRRGGQLQPSMASRFLQELPAELIDERRTSFGVGGLGTSRGWGGEWSGGRGNAPSRNRPPAPIAVPAPRRREAVFVPTAEAANENQDAPRLIKGERVRHRLFGSGAVLGLSGGGKDLKVSVTFDDPEVGTKQLLVAVAGLERDWESA
ncbi:MAG TPA: UvrD-helicase domain-containing protein [Gemmatimonadales bacterium]|nr:UvrD-helicase domain-containing protein [Gemmatimonadales bacterium]